MDFLGRGEALGGVLIPKGVEPVFIGVFTGVFTGVPPPPAFCFEGVPFPEPGDESKMDFIFFNFCACVTIGFLGSRLG